jgi:hypothetical protein
MPELLKWIFQPAKAHTPANAPQRLGWNRLSDAVRLPKPASAYLLVFAWVADEPGKWPKREASRTHKDSVRNASTHAGKQGRQLSALGARRHDDPEGKELGTENAAVHGGVAFHNPPRLLLRFGVKDNDAEDGLVGVERAPGKYDHTLGGQVFEIIEVLIQNFAFFRGCTSLKEILAHRLDSVQKLLLQGWA